MTHLQLFNGRALSIGGGVFSPDGAGGGQTTVYGYSNGVLQGPYANGQDLSGGTMNYLNTTNLEAGHQYNLAASGAFAQWQYASNWTPYYQQIVPGTPGTNGYDLSPFTWLTLDICVPAGGSAFTLVAHYMRGDEYRGADIQVCTSIPPDVLNQVPGVTLSVGWNYNVKIPLAFIGLLSNYNFYKYGIQQTVAGPVLYDNEGFITGNVGWIYRGNPNNGLESGWVDASVNATSNYLYLPNSFNASLYAINHPPSAAANFTASVTGGTQLNILVPSAQGTIVAGQTLFYAGCPVGGVPILSGSGNTWTLGTNVGTLSSQQMMSVLQQSAVCVNQLSVTATGGMWMAKCPAGFSLAPYTYFTFGGLPTLTGNDYSIQVYNTSYAPIGTAINPNVVGTYTPYDFGVNTTAFTVFAVPLSALGVSGNTIGAVSITDTSGNTTNTILLSAIGLFS
jgi:hypothetical protein